MPAELPSTEQIFTETNYGVPLKILGWNTEFVQLKLFSFF